MLVFSFIQNSNHVRKDRIRYSMPSLPPSSGMAQGTKSHIREDVTSFLCKNDKFIYCMMLAMCYAALQRKYEANAHICLDRKCIFKMMLKQHSSIEQRWGRSSVWLERLPVTQEAV